MTAELPVVLLAGGGTGGHVFPMVAVADALRAQAEIRVVYVGTARGIEARVVPARGDELELLDVLPIQGQGVIGAARGLLRAAGTLPRARSLIRRLGPRAVLAVGGYAAGPVGIWAAIARIPLAILEPNSVLGLANRWLLPFARRAYVAFPQAESKFRREVARRTGVPLRGSFLPSVYTPVPGKFHVLVLGGSQGAKILNEVVPAALALAAGEVPGLSVLHQAGRGRDEDVQRTYRALGAPGRATVVAFLDDVAGELARADLVIERSGAGSLAELCAVGRPAILVPFPFAADDHQQKNAETLARLGGAVVIRQAEASPERLAGEVVRLAKDVERCVGMAVAARVQGRPDAARAVARDLLELAGIGLRLENGAPRGAGSGSESESRSRSGALHV